MWKFISNLLLAALAIGLTFFTASRTLDLLAQWLPANQQIMQWLGLAAFEGGLYFWSLYFVTAAKGIYQRGIAGLMIVVCFIAVATATVADLLLVGAESGKLPDIPSDQKQAIVVFVGIVIVLNVAAFLAAKLTHPDKLKEMAIQDAEDQIHDMELRLIRKLAPSVAMQMAPLKAEQWVNDTWAKMLPGTGGGSQRTIEGSVEYQYQPDPTPPQAPTPTPTRQSAPAKAPAPAKRGILGFLRDTFGPPQAPAQDADDRYEIVQRAIQHKEQDDAQKAQSAPAPQAIQSASYPFVHAPRYIDTEPLTLPTTPEATIQQPIPDLWDDLVDSVAPTVPFQPAPLKESNGAMNGHQK